MSFTIGAVGNGADSGEPIREMATPDPYADMPASRESSFVPSLT